MTCKHCGAEGHLMVDGLTEAESIESTCPECSQPIHWSTQFGCWVHHTAAGIVNCPDPFAIDHLPSPLPGFSAHAQAGVEAIKDASK